jgi:hypothetical protein
MLCCTILRVSDRFIYLPYENMFERLFLICRLLIDWKRYEGAEKITRELCRVPHISSIDPNLKSKLNTKFYSTRYFIAD